MIVVRYADDIVCGFEHEAEARRFMAELTERLKRFSLTLQEQKTRLLQFGRFAAQNRAKRGLGKPETFNFLGFTQCVGDALVTPCGLSESERRRDLSPESESPTQVEGTGAPEENLRAIRLHGNAKPQCVRATGANISRTAGSSEEAVCTVLQPRFAFASDGPPVATAFEESVLWCPWCRSGCGRGMRISAMHESRRFQNLVILRNGMRTALMGGASSIR